MNPTKNFLDVPPVSVCLTGGFGEEIVVDDRNAYSPSDLVQQKLQSLLPASAIPVSCLHAGRQVRRYTV